MKVTKLVVPAPPGGGLVRRPRLEQRLGPLLEAPVTIVRGGAGFGKTTLMREWAERLRERAVVAWLSLDEYDAPPTALAEAFDASLRRVATGFGTSVRTLLERGVDDARRLAIALSNELLAWSSEHSQDLALFVDDTQFVMHDAGAVSFLSELLSGLPDGVHVVLATRAPLQFAPIGKLRATRRLAEIDQDQLRFTREEAAALFGDDGAVAHYFDFADGWPIALGLLAQISRSGEEAFDHVAERTRESLFDFLAEEVVARLPVDLATTLGVLAIPAAFDRASAKVLANVDDPDGLVLALMDYGLYVSKHEDDEWRMHALFRTFLIDRLRRVSPQIEHETRMRYAHWLREHGRKTEALEQLLDAGEYEEIIPFVSEALVAIHFSDRYKSFIQLLSTVPEQIMRAKPLLHLFYARALMREGKAGLAQEQLQKCYERAMEAGEYTIACIAQLELGVIADNFMFLQRTQHPKSEVCFRKALEIAERPELESNPTPLNQAHLHLGMLHACRSEFDLAFKHLGIAEKIERASSRHVGQLFIEIALVHGWRGDWQRALEYAQIAEEMCRTGGGEFWIGNALIEQARAHTQIRTEPARAVEVARAAIIELQKVHREDDLSAAYVALGHALLVTQPPAVDEASAAARAADEALARFAHPVVEFDNELLKIEIAMFAGNDAEARMHVAAARSIANASHDRWQQAMSLFYDAARELACGSPAVARDAFVAAIAALNEAGDRYNAVLANAALLGCDARTGVLSSEQLAQFFQDLRTQHLEYAMRGAPQSAASLLAWAIGHDTLVDSAVELLSDGAAGSIEPVERAAQDTSLPAKGRAAAIRVLARVAPSRARSVIAPLTRDADPTVAGSAQMALELLPGASAEPLYVDVVDALRVRIGENEFDETSERWGRRRAAELLRFLALSGRAVTKTALFAALWPDHPSVTDTTLRVTLHMTRRALQPQLEGTGDYIEYDGTLVRLRPEFISGIDVVDADAALRRAQLLRARGDIDDARHAAGEALNVYSRAPREEDVSQWLRPHVRAWRDAAVSGYLLLCAIERESQNATQALWAAERAVAFDPLSESATTMLLDVLLDSGKVDAARTAFQEYRRRLSQQLDASPGPAIMERYTRIAAGTPRRSAADELSGREREVLVLVARGLSNKQIAGELGLSTWTVNNHMAKILRKLNVESRTAAAAVLAGVPAHG